MVVASASADPGVTIMSPTSTEVVSHGSENQPGSGSSKVVLPASAVRRIFDGHGLRAASSGDPARSATPAADANARAGAGSVSHTDPVWMSLEASCPQAARMSRMTASSSLTDAPTSMPVAVSRAATEPVSGVPNVTTLLISADLSGPVALGWVAA